MKFTMAEFIKASVVVIFGIIIGCSTAVAESPYALALAVCEPMQVSLCGEVLGDKWKGESGDRMGTNHPAAMSQVLQFADLQAVATQGSFGTERGRFELPRAFRPDRFSKPAHSTTLPPLRGD